MIMIHEDGSELQSLNEFVIDITNMTVPDGIQRSIFYPKLKTLLFREINSFCREHTTLKADLHFLRMQIGSVMSEQEIKKQFDDLIKRYNTNANDNIGLLYHYEATKFDYGVVLTVIIKRSEIEAKNFVFRFLKKDVSDIGLNFRSQSSYNNITENFITLKNLEGDK
mgnify:CR=1 FL=1